MKIKKLKLLTAAAFLLMCLLAFGGCGDGEPMPLGDIDIADYLAKEYNLKNIEVSADEISSNYGYSDQDGNNYADYLGVVVWLESEDNSVVYENGVYTAEDKEAYAESLPPYEEITRQIGKYLAADHDNYTVEIYHKIDIADKGYLANTATLCFLGGEETYSEINPVLQGKSGGQLPPEILNGEPLTAESITSFIDDNYNLKATAVSLQTEGDTYSVQLQLTANNGDLSEAAAWDENTFRIWQDKVDEINSSVYEIYQFLNETHRVRAEINVSVGGTDGEAADFNAIQWFKGSYQTDGENFGSLHCDYRDFGTEAYNAAKSTDYQTEFDNVIRIF